MAGEAMTLADFALAAHLSALDYLGDVDWEASVEDPAKKPPRPRNPKPQTKQGDLF